MKKLLGIIAFVICITNTCFASILHTDIGVVLIGGSEYKEEHMMNELKEIMTTEKIPNCFIHVGEDEQSKYQNFWFSKGVLDPEEPSPQSFMEYVNYAGYDKVLFLVVKDPVVDTRKEGLFGQTEHKRVSVEIKGYLVGKDKLIGSYTSVNEDDSRFSELRARRGALKKSIKYIYEKSKSDYSK
jgi:hypothetical protein